MNRKAGAWLSVTACRPMHRRDARGKPQTPSSACVRGSAGALDSKLTGKKRVVLFTSCWGLQRWSCTSAPCARQCMRRATASGFPLHEVFHGGRGRGGASTTTTPLAASTLHLPCAQVFSLPYCTPCRGPPSPVGTTQDAWPARPLADCPFLAARLPGLRATFTATASCVGGWGRLASCRRVQSSLMVSGPLPLRVRRPGRSVR